MEQQTARVPLFGMYADGKSALVDEADLRAVSGARWYCHPSGYAYAQMKRDGRRQTVYMHRLLLGEPEGMEVDHMNGDPLDNRRANLRAVTRQQNEQNKARPSSRSTTGVRGVFRQDGRYRARIWVDRRGIDLGRYDTLEEAAAAVKSGKARHQSHSRPNTPAPTRVRPAADEAA